MLPTPARNESAPASADIGRRWDYQFEEDRFLLFLFFGLVYSLFLDGLILGRQNKIPDSRKQ